MNDAEERLLRRLTEHDLDLPGAALSLRDRLARDNGWSRERADRVLDEYRRFAFLAVTAGHPVTPSEDVDQAWHLHLLYTRDYWERFCPDVLGSPLHHGPTRGGDVEGDKFVDWYQRTLDAYRRVFGEPPGDVWPPATERFRGADLFRRVNLGTHLVIDKRRCARALVRLAGPLIAVALIGRALAQAPDDAPGPPWSIVMFWILVIVVVDLIVLAVLRHRRRSGKRRRRGRKRGGGSGSPFIGGCGSSRKHTGNDVAQGDGGGDSGGGSGCGGGGCGGGGG